MATSFIGRRNFGIQAVRSVGVVLTFAIVALFSSVQVSAQSASPQAPMQITGAKTVDAKGVIALIEKHGDKLKIVDNRRAEDFEAGHIEGAVRVLDTDLTEEKMASLAKKAEPVLFYCNGLACGRAAKAAEMSVKWGYTEVHYYALGMDEWKKLGLPLVK